MLASLCRTVEQSGRNGIILEAGCALGGSAILMTALKRPTRPLRIYDVFETIPPPSERDGNDARSRYSVIARGESPGIGDDPYYGYVPDLLRRIRASFDAFELPPADNHVTFVRGLVEDTLRVDEPVALAHLDVDWYEPTLACLERIEPHLVAGGSLVIDDYFDWSGCRRAVDDYFATRDRSRFLADTTAGSLVLTKKTSS